MKVCKGCGGTLDHLSPYEQRYHRYRCNNANYSMVSKDLASLIFVAGMATPALMWIAGWNFFVVVGLLSVLLIGIVIWSSSGH